MNFRAVLFVVAPLVATTAAHAQRPTVDGTLQFDQREIGNERAMPIFTGGVTPGTHSVKVETSSETVHLAATTYELSDVAAPFDRHPQIRWVGGDK